MIIQINDDGLFEKNPEKIMYVPFNKTILFTFIGKKYAHYTPIFLTNFGNTDSKKYQITANEEKTVTLNQIYTDYNYVEGNYEVNLNWSCKIHFNHSGLYFFQIVFIEKKFDDLEVHRKIVIPDHFDYLIVNPPYNGFTMANINKLAENNHPYVSIEDISKSEIFHENGARSRNHSPNSDKRVQSLFYVSDTPEVKEHSKSTLLIDQLGNILNFDTITIITLYPTMLGPIEDWESELEYLIQKGFRGFHFSPIQQLGKSGSLYSIKNPLVLNSSIFGNATSSFDKLNHIFHNLKLKHNVFFIIDIIWNHCSFDAEWILEEPSSYTSVRNTPCLNAAFTLNNSLMDLSENLLHLNITNNNLIDSLDDVSKIVDYIRSSVLQPLKFEEFFVMDVKAILLDVKNLFHEVEVQDLKNIVQNGNSEFYFVDADEFNIIKSKITNLGASRFGVHIPTEWLLEYLTQRPAQLAFSELGKILKQINIQMKTKVQEWFQDIIRNIQEEIIERFLNKNIKSVSTDYPLVQNYFCQLSNGDYALLNGNVKGKIFFEDFSLELDQFYFRRNMNVWQDSIKLNYQPWPNSMKLWNVMNEYTKQMARVFDGFRLNNFHSTKIDTAKFFINSAMQANESLFLFTELFSNSLKCDVNFCLKVGVHRLVRELQDYNSLTNIINLIQDYVQEGSSFAAQIPPLCENNYEITYLKASKPLPIIFDQTYENPTYFQKFNIFVQLPILAIENFVSLMTGTTRGFDELFVHAIPSHYAKKYPRLKKEIKKFHDHEKNVVFLIKPEYFGELNRIQD